ncbi:NADH-quinone oxidoreductase chain M [Gordonia araii NBRC 100433]|uniref:NADH-quinone oxidoreductase chain M n=1 Tax=Gordonia araii NBRC 100433 TaxID=1073574 RepID=G7GXL1_9ACTN|nr:NADH-quinone oxidoreductase subunit M [Gordonia araii]NNG98225.1 NADH-quinone oxidoreductase subunit M [Gordonia araii NBRC 100433]GAB08336.1 NADH-quinone oxidoreductase chain M [Gordonia araii NBRC 100433]
MTSIPWLTVLWLLPAAGAIAVALSPAGSRRRWPHTAGLVIALATLGWSIAMTVAFNPGGARFDLVESHRWIPAIGARYELGLDGIGLVLVLLTTALVPLLLLAGWRDTDGEGSDPRIYVALTLAVQAMVLLSFVATDILLFYLVFEAMLIPMYFLIGGWGQLDKAVRARAALKFLLYNLFGGLVMLAGVIGLSVLTVRADLGEDGRGTFGLTAITEAIADGKIDVGGPAGIAICGAFLFAFAVKAPVWPVHAWLPDAAVAGTPSTGVLMMAVMDKVGTFAMLRFVVELFGDTAARFAPWMCALAVVSIVYGLILAIGQTDVMRLIAYTSISHFGFIVLGVFALSPQSQAGATLYMVNHGISTAALFLVAGFLTGRRSTRLIADYCGVQKVAPVLSGVFLVAGLATLSLPGLAPFVSEFLVMVGSFGRYPVAAVVATVALVGSAVYILWTYQRMMGGPAPDGATGGPSSDEKGPVADLGGRERLVLFPLIAALLILGFWPRPALDPITPAVDRTLDSVTVSVPPHAPRHQGPAQVAPTGPARTEHQRSEHNEQGGHR